MKVLKIALHAIAILHITQCIGTPAYIFIIRHGEKTTTKQAVNFQQWHLVASQPLDPRGWQRAFALAPYFTRQPEITKHGKVQFLFAPKPNKNYNSVRAIQTLTPLSHALDLVINHNYELEEICEFVEHVMTDNTYHGRTILIAYEYHHIPVLAAAFKEYKHPKSTAHKSSKETVKPVTLSTTWDSNVFDRVWILGFDTKLNELISFENRPQRLLFGDSRK